MPIYKEGQNAINNIYNPVAYNNILANIENQELGRIKAVRVKSIILDSNHPRYEELGGPNSIGTILYDDNVEIPNINNNLPSSDFYIGLDAVRFENVSTTNPVYGLTGYTVLKNNNAETVIKVANTTNYIEFRFAMDVQ